MEKHELIARIDAHLSGVPVTDAVTVAGLIWHLKVLDRFEEADAKTYIPDSASVLQAFSDTTLQQLTLALQAIDFGDGRAVPLDELFPADAETAKKGAAAAQRATRHQAMEWLGRLPGTLTQELWMSYLGLKDSSRKVLEGLTAPLSKKATS